VGGFQCNFGINISIDHRDSAYLSERRNANPPQKTIVNLATCIAWDDGMTSAAQPTRAVGAEPCCKEGIPRGLAHGRVFARSTSMRYTALRRLARLASISLVTRR
jgi:hypothetical protein